MRRFFLGLGGLVQILVWSLFVSCTFIVSSKWDRDIWTVTREHSPYLFTHRHLLLFLGCITASQRWPASFTHSRPSSTLPGLFRTVHRVPDDKVSLSTYLTECVYIYIRIHTRRFWFLSATSSIANFCLANVPIQAQSHAWVTLDYTIRTKSAFTLELTLGN